MSLKSFFVVTLLLGTSFCKSFEAESRCDFQEAVKNASRKIQLCLESGLDLDELEADMKSAKSLGNFDEVAKRHCVKGLHSKSCYVTAIEEVAPCLSEMERANLLIVRDIVDNMAEATCDKEGRLLSGFAAGVGLDCLFSKQNELEQCEFNTIISQMERNSAKGIHVYQFNKDGCDQISAMQECMVKEMKTCSDPIFAKLTKDLFEASLEFTPCKLKQDLPVLTVVHLRKYMESWPNLRNAR